MLPMKDVVVPSVSPHVCVKLLQKPPDVSVSDHRGCLTVWSWWDREPHSGVALSLLTLLRVKY